MKNALYIGLALAVAGMAYRYARVKKKQPLPYFPYRDSYSNPEY